MRSPVKWEVWRGTQRAPGLPKPHYRVSRVLTDKVTNGDKLMYVSIHSIIKQTNT
jgi:hypothetical protein